MKYLIITLIILSGCASWTKEQVVLQGAASTLSVVDWGQTLDIVDKTEYYETNPILGKYPSRGDVNRYFACFMGTQILITHLLPSKYRKSWLSGNILISGYYINNNYRIGLKFNY